VAVEEYTNKMVINKRGLSAVVATVLIILITVAAVTIIWAAIIPQIQKQMNLKFNITEDVCHSETHIDRDECWSILDKSDSINSYYRDRGCEVLRQYGVMDIEPDCEMLAAISNNISNQYSDCMNGYQIDVCEKYESDSINNFEIANQSEFYSISIEDITIIVLKDKCECIDWYVNSHGIISDIACNIYECGNQEVEVLR